MTEDLHLRIYHLMTMNFFWQIVDVKTNRILGPLKEGEIWTKGPHLMSGYYQNRKSTSEIIDENGWLHTGDIGYYDEDGDFFLLDRLKELIKYKAYQVGII